MFVYVVGVSERSLRWPGYN